MRYSAHTGQTSDNGEASRPRASHNHPSDAYSLAAVNRKRAEWASPTNITNEAAKDRRVTPAQLGHLQREADAEVCEEHLSYMENVSRDYLAAGPVCHGLLHLHVVRWLPVVLIKLCFCNPFNKLDFAGSIHDGCP